MSNQWQARRGTTAQNDAFTGASGEITYDTDSQGLRVHDGTKQGGYLVDTVVDFQKPTAENNYTWYRLYASGWVEQGGAVLGLSDWANITITLPVPMSNRGYSYIQSPIMYAAGGSGAWEVGVTAKTETQVSSRFFANNGFLPTWQVSGMAA